MGSLISTHAVDTGRRHALGRVAVAIALACAVLLALAFVLDLDGAQYGLLAAVVPLLVAAPAAAVLLRKARRPEVVELHDDGIAHVFGGVRRQWAWDEVAALDIAERGYDAGVDPDCTIRFADGALLHVSGRTENSRVIVAALDRHCADATRRPVRRPHKARAAAVLAVIALAGGGAAAWVVLTNPAGGLAVLGVAAAVPAVVSLILLVAVLVTGRR
ncbi:hypothetical protein [Lentzea sp. NPDC003310]|uniref:hypothetical protein n=1 Tax=Lentzea sp. NPDC003310 TaxID=3154447 RepID=UPI0033B86F0B